MGSTGGVLVTHRRFRSSGALALLALAALLGRGCADGEPSTRTPAGSSGSAGLSASGAAGLSSSGGAAAKAGAAGKAGHGGKAGQGAGGGGAGQGGCPAIDWPAGVPEDWEEFTGWSCDCRFYVPGSKGTPPPPIQWEDCSGLEPPTLSCKWMASPWQTKTLAFGLRSRYSLDPQTGKPLLFMDRIRSETHPDHMMYVVAEADGAVRAAYLKTIKPNTVCETYLQDLSGDKFVFSIVGDNANKDTNSGPEGVIAGGLDDPYHPVVLKYPLVADGLHSAWSVSASTLARVGGDAVGMSWDLSSSSSVYTPLNDPQELVLRRIKGFHEAFFLSVGDTTGAVLRWTPSSGLSDIIRFDDFAHGAFNFGTDGHDMVWTYGEKKTAASKDFSKATVMTSPFSINKDLVKQNAKPLASDFLGPAVDPFVVGCGYTARSLFDPSIYNGVFIVRLSDGFSWTLPGAPVGAQRSYGRALGLTCDELFVEVGTTTEGFSIARIRLDSLGPGKAPN